MSIKPAKVQFNGGELSPWLEARTDIAKYDKTAKLCRNFIPLIEGSIKRRGGSRFISFTPEVDDVLFKIKAYPEEAEIIINGEVRDNIIIAPGEYVSYEVRCEGYTSYSNKVYVSKDVEIEVYLVSNTDKCVLTINPEPTDAVVKIEGFERNEAQFNKNSNVFYVVYKNGYQMKSGNIVLSCDVSIDVVLDKDIEDEQDESSLVYKDWGKPLYFVSCSAVGHLDRQLKCILLRFENGYLPVVFDAKLTAPDKIDESLFIYSDDDGYDAVAFVKGKYILSVIKREGDITYYRDLDGNVIANFHAEVQKILGWQIDENRKYASYYATYDGSVSGYAFKVYYKGELVWSLKGRD